MQQHDKHPYELIRKSRVWEWHPPLDGTHVGKKGLVNRRAMNLQSDHPQAMLTELYIEALLVDEELADMVWDAWDRREIDDLTAYFCWLITALRYQTGIS